jgi:DNA-binding GntR family transcriptional regulator
MPPDDDPARPMSHDAATPAALAIPVHGSTTDAVTDALREAILSGSLPADSWLREQELARSMRVSRTPVREALCRLADERLIERSANRGCRVRTMTLDDVLAVYVVRESLECLAARTAAARPPAGLTDRLLQLHRAMETATAPSELSRLNLEFHRTIREAAGNTYLDRFLTQVEHAVRRFGQSTLADPDRAAECRAEHMEIIQAIGAADPEMAEQAAGNHMRKARNARIQHLLQSLGDAQLPAAAGSAG